MVILEKLYNLKSKIPKSLNRMIPNFLIKKLSNILFPYYFVFTSHEKLPEINYKSRFNLDTICIYNPLDKEKIIKKSKKKVNIFFKKKFLNIINVGRFTDQKDQITLLKGLNLFLQVSYFVLLPL